MGERIRRTLLGFALLIPGVPLAILLPEIGIPLVLVGLRLLAPYYVWAGRANAWLSDRWERAHAWYARQSYVVRVLVLLATSLLAIVVLAVLLS